MVRLYGKELTAPNLLQIHILEKEIAWKEKKYGFYKHEQRPDCYTYTKWKIAWKIAWKSQVPCNLSEPFIREISLTKQVLQ